MTQRDETGAVNVERMAEIAERRGLVTPDPMEAEEQGPEAARAREEIGREHLAQALSEFVETTFHEDPDEQLEECRAIVARLEPGEFDALCCLFEGRPAPEQQDDTEEYTLTPEWDTVGGGPCWEGEPVTFRGNLLTDFSTDFSTRYPDAQRWAVWRVYRTIRGRIVVSQAHFSLWQGERNGRTVEVYDSIQAVPVEDRDDHPHAVPVAVINQAREALGLPVGRRVE